MKLLEVHWLHVLSHDSRRNSAVTVIFEHLKTVAMETCPHTDSSLHVNRMVTKAIGLANEQC